MADRTEPNGAVHTKNNVNPVKRQEQIAERVLQHGSVSSKDLATRFGVSIMTIHRDLDELENQGIVRKFRGGATPQPSSVFESNVHYRLTTARAEKEALSRFALTQIESGQVVMLDDSTTTLSLARLLHNVTPVTVITNFLSTINELSGVKGVQLISLGGEYMPSHDAFIGIDCQRAITALRADIYFMSTSAISRSIAFHQEQEIVAIKQTMMESATRRILLADHSKFGRVALHRLASLHDFDLIVVDAGVNEATLGELHDHKLPFKVASL